MLEVFRRLGSVQSTRSRLPGATTTSCCTRAWPTTTSPGATSSTSAARSSRRTTRDSPSSRRASSRGSAGRGARARRASSPRTPRWPSTCSSASAPRGRCRRSTSSAIAGRRPTGSGSRRTPCAPCSRRTPSRACSASRDATTTDAPTTSSSDCYRPTCSRRSVPLEEQLRHKLLSRYRAHGLLGVGGGGDIFGGIGPAKPDPRSPGHPGRTALVRSSIADGERSGRGRRGAREAVRLKEEVALLEGAAGAAALRRIPAAVRSVGLGPGPPRIALRLRLRVGALPPAGQAALGLVRAAAARRRPPRRPDRAAHRPRRGQMQVLDLWWEDGFSPRRTEDFVDAMRDALRAYLRFAGATRLEWAPQLAAEDDCCSHVRRRANGRLVHRVVEQMSRASTSCSAPIAKLERSSR